MQNYQEKAIPLVFRNQDSKYQANPEAIQFLRSIQGKLAIISVAGVYRTGKSYLLNTMLLNKKNGFAVGPTTNPKTKGIWVWGKPLILKNDQNEIINVLIMDSEGLGSTDEDINHDLRLFSITLLLSSSFMYNTLGAIDQNAIDSLGLVLRLCEHLKNAKFNDFPDFYWILRDFSLALVDKQNNSMSPKMYLQSCLSAQPGDSQLRNKIRTTIKQAFHNRNLFTFIRPLLDESSLQNLQSKPLQELRPEFVQQVLDFRKQIFNHLKIKSIKGRQVSGSMLGELLSIYVDAINEDKIPVIENGWEQLCLKQLHQVLDQIQKAVQDKVRSLKTNIPRCKKQLIEQQKKILEQFQHIFRKRLQNNHKADQYFGSIKQMVNKQMKGIETEMKHRNGQQAQKFVKKQFESIQKRIKESEIKNMGYLVKQFEIFYEYFRKKCPYKDQINAGMEVLFKKFSDSALLMYKNIQKKKNSEIEEHKNQLEKISETISAKQQKNRQQKNKLQNTNAILQSKLQQLQKQNNIIQKSHHQLQATIQELQAIINKNQEQNLSDQNLILKKQLLELENNYNQLSCQHNQQLSEFKQKIELQNNEIDNLQKYRAQLSIKYQELESMHQGLKHQSSQQINKLALNLNSIQQQKCKQQLIYKQKIDVLENQLAALESALGKKNQQIAEITENQTIETSIRFQKTLAQKQHQITQKQQKLQCILQQHEKLKQQSETTINSLQNQLSQLQQNHTNMINKLQQQIAILKQKLEFMESQNSQKTTKNVILLKQNENYIGLFEEKDERIEELMRQIQQLKNYDENQSQQIQTKIQQMAIQLEQRGQQIVRLQQQKQKIQQTLQRKLQTNRVQLQQSNIIIKKLQQQLSQLHTEKQSYHEKDEQIHQKHIQNLQNIKQQYQKQLNQQKRSTELSLVQLKNYYEIEKQKLEKKLLEERKKYQFNETNKIIDLENKHKKLQKLQHQQILTLKQTKQQLQEKYQKMENQYQIKFMSFNQEIEAQKKMYVSKFETIKKKYEQLTQQHHNLENQHQQQRINYIKKIESLNFELTRKQKQIIQLNIKKQNMQTNLQKKDGQLDNIRKTMHQQIENSLKKVSEVQTKYQKINQQYMHFKIEAQKQIALCKQRNQFLTVRLSQLNKQKQSESMKNIEKFQKNKISQYKQQIDRLKNQNISLEAKIDNLRKNQKQLAFSHKKQVTQLQKQIYVLQEKLQGAQSKFMAIQIKNNQQIQAHSKKMENQLEKHQKQLYKIQQKLTNKDKQIVQYKKQMEKTSQIKQQLTLMTNRVNHVEYQRDQKNRELQQTQKRLQAALTQLKKSSDKSIMEESGIRRQSIDKRYNNQLQLVRMSSKVRQQQLQQISKRLKQQNKQLKQKNIELYQKISRLEKNLQSERNNIDEIQRIKRQRQQTIFSLKNQSVKEGEQFKKKIIEYQKKNRELQKKNGQFIFILEKQKAKRNIQKQQLQERIKALEDQLAWGKYQKAKKQKNQGNKQFSMTSSDGLGRWR